MKTIDINKIHIVVMTCEITFNDSDYGRCNAGEKSRIIKVFKDEDDAKSFVEKWDLIIRAANNEKTIIPVQPNNKLLRYGLGFDLHSFDQDERDYKLEIKSFDVE